MDRLQSDLAEEFIVDAAERTEAPPQLGIARRRLGREGYQGVARIFDLLALSICRRFRERVQWPSESADELAGVEPAKHNSHDSGAVELLKITGEAIAAELRGDVGASAADCQLDVA